MSKEQLKVSRDKKLRHYTVRIVKGRDTIAKYRTDRMTPEEFEEASYNTDRDWYNYIRFNELKKIK